MQIKEIPPPPSPQTTPLTENLVTKRWFAKASPTTKIKTIAALSLIVGEKWEGPTGRGSRPIPFKFRTTDYLSDTILTIPSSIRLSPLFLVNLHKNTWTNLGWLVHDILPTSINWDAIHLWWMILAFYDAFAELAYLSLAWPFLADSPISSCADNISNRNGFGKVHLLLFNVQWDLD